MRLFFPATAVLLLAGFILPAALQAQGFGNNTAFTCSVSAGAPPTVRAESEAKYLPDLILTCTGGNPTLSGNPIPTTNLQLFFNTDISNRIDANNFSDALLVIDEPHSAANPSVPLLACGAAGSNDNGSGMCPIVGNGNSIGVYDGTVGRPNVFQGVVVANNSIAWLSVPIDPVAAGTRILRFTNLRANLAKFGASVGSVAALVSANGSQQITIENPRQTLAFFQPGLTGSAGGMATLTQCAGANPGITADPTKPLDSGVPNGAQFSITLREGFPGAFRVKNWAQLRANGPTGGVFGTGYPADVNQNIPGVFYQTETHFFNGAADPNPLGALSKVLSTPNFPSVRNLNQAGLSDQGTRVYVSLTGVPAGMKLYVPVQVPLLSAEAGNLNQQTGTAVLISTDSNGAGSFVPVAGNAAGLAPLLITGSTAMAVYEVLYSDPSSTETITIPMAAAYAAGALSIPTGGQQIAVQAGFAPISTGSSGTTAPRFVVSLNITQYAFLVKGWAQPDLTLSMTHSGDFTIANGGTFSLVVRNSGDAPTVGSVTLTDTLPAGLTADAISGPGWNCSLGSLTCTRSDSLVSGSSYPPVALTVSVSANAPSAVTNVAIAYGGGESVYSNERASDLVNIVPLQIITVNTNQSGLSFTVDGVTYTNSQTFQWHTGSTHSISTTSPQSPPGPQAIFNRWSDSAALAHTITVGSAPATYTATFGPPSSAIQCVPNVRVPPIIPSEARSALAGDLYLKCTGGTPTAAGSPIPQVDIKLSLNVNLTSRLTAPGFTEALLLMDEPRSFQGATDILLACGAPGSNDNGSGVCPITGDGIGQATYNGSSGHPNVFQGQTGAANEIVWKGVPVDAPGLNGVRVLRIKNVRVNASQLPWTGSFMPPQVQATISITPGGIAVSNPTQIMAFLQPSLAQPGNSTATVLAQCASANPGILADPSKPLDSGGQNGAQFSLLVLGGYAGSFMVKNYAQIQSNNPNNHGNGTQYPADLNQNAPGYWYNTETGFFNGADTDATISYNSGPTPKFPRTRGLDIAGKADSGTRIYAKFSSIPSPGSQAGAAARSNSATTAGGLSLDRNVITYYGPLNGPPVTLTMLLTSSKPGGEPFTTVVGLDRPWLTVTPVTGVATATPLALTVRMDPSQSMELLPGSSFAIAGTDQDVLSASVSYTFVENTLHTITASPNSLAFSQTVGSAAPNSQTVSLTSAAATSYSISSNAPWLSVIPSGGTSPGPLVVTAYGSGLPVGPYAATITLTGGSSPLIIPVSLTVTANAIAAAPVSVAFSQMHGGASPTAQTVSLTSAAPTSFTVTSAASWLSVATSSQTTPATLTLVANGAGLAAGSYSSSITVTAGGSSFAIPVSFTLTSESLGMKLFVPLVIPLAPYGTIGDPGANQRGAAVLVSTDANGAGPYAPVVGNAAGLAPLTISNGTAMAVYEIVSFNLNALVQFNLPVAAAFTANQPAAGQIMVEYGLAPWSSVDVSDSTGPIPRFAKMTNILPAFTIQACASTAVQLSIALSHASNFTQGQVNAHYLATVTNTGITPASGIVVTETLPAGLTLASVSSPLWTCSGAVCSLNSPLQAGASVALDVYVNVAGNAAASVTNQVAVTAPGLAQPVSASDVTGIDPGATLVSGSGAGSTQSFTFTFPSPGGYQNLAGAQIVINSTLTAVNSCYILFARPDTLSLAGDSGFTFQSTSLGAPAVLQNSQCIVLASMTSQSGSGNTVTLTLDVAFKAGFAGAKTIWSNYNTNAGLAAGYQMLGRFTATPPQSGFTSSVSPASGSGQAQEFTFSYFDSNGATDISGAQIVFNSILSGTHGCYILFSANNVISLASDDANSFSTAVLGKQTVLQNSQCSVFPALSYQKQAGQTLSVTVFVVFNPGFAGTKNIYTSFNNNAGVSSGFSNIGNWAVAATASISAKIVSPPVGSGPSQALKFIYSDPAGYADILGSQVIVGANPARVNSCTANFNRAAGSITLFSDDGVASTSGNLGQATALQNSQCIVNLAASSQFGAGDYLLLTLFVSMKTSGNQNIYSDTTSTTTFTPLIFSTWNVTSPASMTPVSVSPLTGAGAAETTQFLTFTLSDPAGASDISGALIVLYPSLQGANSCYILWGHNNNLLSLASDNAQTFTSATAGTPGLLSNSQCTVDTAQSFSVQTGNTVNLTVAVAFKAVYEQFAQIYSWVNVQDTAHLLSGWSLLGRFTVQ